MKSVPTNNRSFVFLFFLTLVNLFVLLFLKYNLNGIPLQEFRFDYTGNIINIAVTVLLITGLIFNVAAKKNVDKKRVSLLFTFQIITAVLLVLLFLFEKFDLISANGYLFNFPAKKVYTGFLFILSTLLQIYSALYVWGIIFGSESLLEIRTLIRMIAAVFLLLFFSLFYVWNVSAYSEMKIDKSIFEYGCVPGAAVWSRGKPSPIFEGRIRKALELYRKGIISKIILTGGNAPGEISESEAAAKYLINLDVPKKNILVETQSSTTTEQIKFLRRDYFRKQDQKPILIISDGFHLSRIIQIAKFFKVNAAGISSDHSLSFEKTLFYRAREGVALLLFWLFAI
ncbi:MAG: YdcF family protein [Bacteroidota bacterium]